MESEIAEVDEDRVPVIGEVVPSVASAFRISVESGPSGSSDALASSEMADAGAGGGCDSSDSVGCVSPFRMRLMLGRV